MSIYLYDLETNKQIEIEPEKIIAINSYKSGSKIKLEDGSVIYVYEVPTRVIRLLTSHKE